MTSVVALSLSGGTVEGKQAAEPAGVLRERKA